MELKKNQFITVGIFLILLGIQFRIVSGATLNEKTTRFIAARASAADNAAISIMPGPTARKFVETPRGLGWGLIAVGAILVLHAVPLKGE